MRFLPAGVPEIRESDGETFPWNADLIYEAKALEDRFVVVALVSPWELSVLFFDFFDDLVKFDMEIRMISYFLFSSLIDELLICKSRLDLPLSILDLFSQVEKKF